MRDYRGRRLCLLWGQEAYWYWGASGPNYKGAQSASEVTLVLGSASVALVQSLPPCDLGEDSTGAVTRGTGEGYRR